MWYRFSKVGYLICILKGWLNSGRLPIDDGYDSGRIIIGNKNVLFVQIGMKQCWSGGVFDPGIFRDLLYDCAAQLQEIQVILNSSVIAWPFG